MSFFQIKEDFLSNINEGDFYDSSRITYSRKINVFYEYLSEKCGVTDSNYEEILSAIGENKLLDSIEFYVNENNIKFKITVENYFTVIKSYFDFISKKYGLNNKNFDSTTKYSNIKDKVDKKIKSLKLEESKQKPPITKSACHNIIEYCDKKIKDFDIKNININKIKKEKSRQKDFNLFVSSFITKIIILTGIKNNVINSIKLKDYKPELNILTINGFDIHLPNELGVQIKKYILVRDQISTNKDVDGPFFINRQGHEIGTNYNFAFTILKDLLNSNSAESVAKYTIIQFINKGININLVKELTGFGDDTFMHCQEIVNEEKNKEDIVAKNRYIDSKIRSIEIFDIL
ncbi:hypothetical protein [Clostridium felsineum]|uniref:hypothetical protein n=1 Tax=Clostridium felsineum TaxID=36839 RepID=UPI00098CCF17|nr:hypothetical protein [Clostridium felsineum]URZ17196.1 hypothetical protein CLFE_032480 [Clostridium felsineum DSM 794]